MTPKGYRGYRRAETRGIVETGLTRMTVLKHYLTGNMGNTGETGVTIFFKVFNADNQKTFKR